MLSISQLKELFEKNSIVPNKRLGQNFLVDEKVLSDIIATAKLTKNDSVIEVGGGVGALTKDLAEQAGRVISVEKDRRLTPLLREAVRGYPNVEIIEGDILKFRASRFKLQDYKLIGTPPYYLTARLFRTFLEGAERRPSCIVLIIQKEVAQRICAKPPRMNLLALSVQLYGKPSIIRPVSKGAFWPRPNVDSALLVVSARPKPFLAPSFVPLFFRVIRAGFAHPRQQLRKTLSVGIGLPPKQTLDWLKKNSVDPARRAETLTLEEWKGLLENYPL